DHKTRFGPDDAFWVVVDPGSDASTIEDLLFRASLSDLYLQFRGGLSMDSHPTLFTDEQDARREALGRLVAARAARAISAYVASGGDLRKAKSIVLEDGGALPVFGSEL